jgi:DHA1 family tetracycline resistance protein-like MFS transporter
MKSSAASKPASKGQIARSWQRWRQWIEPWYLVYAALGAMVAGLVPVLLPLLIVSRAGSAAQVGLVMAAVNLGGLTAPAWGSLADRFRLHRWLLTGGLVIIALGLAGFSLTTQPAAWLGLAFLQGIGAAGAATVANLFVVEAHPKAEWDQRIGWLQTFYGLGQVGGLLLAGLLSQLNLQAGLLVTAGLSAAAAVVSWFTAHSPPAPSTTKPVLLHPARTGEWAMISPQRLFHHMDLSALKKLGPALRSPFGVFLLIWLFIVAGPAALFSQYPVVMQTVFGVAPGISSPAFAVAAALGLALYSPAGRWSEQRGPLLVMRIALGVRLLAFLALLGLGITRLGVRGWLALVAFALIVVAWSVISVCGTALAASLSAVGEGEGLGIFNAVNALAGVLGAVLGGWIAGTWGYGYLSTLGMVGIVAGLGFSLLPGLSAAQEKEPAHP